MGYKLQDIFEKAITLSGEERDRFIRQACGDDDVLRFKAERLLDTHESLETYDDGATEEAMLTGLAKPEPQQPVEIAGYQITRPIGSGGMGDVYLATRQLQDVTQQVAIKVMKTSNPRPTEKRRFLQEQQFLAQLEHPNIARFIDGGYTTGQHPFVVMEYVSGQHILSPAFHDLPVRKKLGLFVQVCEAIQYIHQHLIIHKDLKPNNILINDAWQPKILDFGIARSLEEDHTQTMTLALTPRYASPEMINQEPLSMATDVYSLGVVLYEFLTGCHPKDSMPNFLATPDLPSVAVLQTSQEGRRSPARLSRHFKGDLDAIIMTALKADPDERYQSVEAFQRDIENFLKFKPISIKQPTLLDQSIKFYQRHKVATILTTALSASIITLMVFVGLQFKDIKQQRTELLNRQQVILAEKEKVYSLSNAFELAFANADPTRSGNAEVSANDILDELNQLITNDVWNSADSQLYLAMGLGQIYLNTGQHEKTVDLLEPFLNGLDDLPEDNQKALLILVLNGDMASLSRSDFEDQYKQLVNRWPEDAGVLQVKGHWLKNQGDYQAAEEAFAAAFEQFNPEQHGYLNNCYLLAGIRSKMSMFNESSELMRHCLSVASAPANDKSLAWQRTEALNLMANNLGYLNQPEASSALTRQVIEERTAIVGADHLYVTDLYANLGSSYSQLGEYDEAHKMHQRTLAKRIELYGENDERVFMTLYNMANNQIRNQQHQKAIDLLMRIIENIDIYDSKYTVNLSFIFQSLSHAHMQLEQYDKAEYFTQEALRVLLPLDGFTGNKNWSRLVLAELAILQGNLAHGEALIRQIEQGLGEQSDPAFMKDVQRVRAMHKSASATID
ncbi:protein kinase [Marinicella sediminis]|uniref:Protein kinase n=1 Tax=Marinicella sediminis TaxID=1792834 RepID=A0ABV7JBM9_9GAMM|nr:serine/threonine-protein kinase [Marinicella sediminis]